MTYSIIQKSQLEGAQRIDAEYYQPEYLTTNSLVAKFGYNDFSQIIDVLTDYHANGSYETLKNNVTLESVPDHALMVRAIDLEHNNFHDDVRYVSKTAYEFLNKSKIFGNEIIIDKIGNAGAVYFMPILNRPVTLGMNLFLVRVKKEINPEYIYIFLNSRYGKLLIEQKTTGINPKSIDKNSVRSIKIPKISRKESKKIADLVQTSLQLSEKSDLFYQQAEDLLLEELGLQDFKPENELFSIVDFSKIIAASRNDAEFYQTKYQKLKDKLNGKIKPLTSLVEAVQPNYEPAKEPEKDFNYVELSNINSSIGIIGGSEKVIGKEAPSRARRVLKAGDVIVSSVEGSLDKVALVSKEQDGYLASTGFFQFRSNKIAPEVLLVLMKGIVMQWQLKQNCAGTILTAVPIEALNKMYIPILPQPTQQKIAELVRRSHTARQKSKELLEEAKRKVETSIEAQSKGNN